MAKGLRRAARASIHQSAAISLSAAVALVPRSDCPSQKPTVNRHSNSARRSKTGASCSRHFLSLSSVSTFGSSHESITTTGSLRYLRVEAQLTRNVPTSHSICACKAWGGDPCSRRGLIRGIQSRTRNDRNGAGRERFESFRRRVDSSSMRTRSERSVHQEREELIEVHLQIRGA